MFRGDDRLRICRRPIDRPEIPVAAESGEARPFFPVCRPSRRAVEGKAGLSGWCVLVAIGRPAGFVAAADGIAVDPLPVPALVSAVPQPEPDDFDRHVSVHSIHDHTGTAAGPVRFGARIREALEQRARYISPLLRRLREKARQHAKAAAQSENAAPQRIEGSEMIRMHRKSGEASRWLFGGVNSSNIAR